jgi:membrane protein
MRFRAILELLQETLAEWSKDKVSRLAAALSYYTIFSIAPLLIIVIAVAGAFFGEDAARGAIEKQLQGLIGDGAIVIQTAIKNANKPFPNQLGNSDIWCNWIICRTPRFSEYDLES